MGTARNYDLLVGVDDPLVSVDENLDPVGAPGCGVDQHSCDSRVEQDVEVLPVLKRSQESSGGAESRTVFVSGLGYRESRVVVPVDVSGRIP